MTCADCEYHGGAMICETCEDFKNFKYAEYRQEEIKDE